MNRADRRRQRKADEQAVKLGLDVVDRSADQLASLMRILHLALQECRQAGSIEQLGSRLFAVSEATASRLAGVKIACRRACSFCCNSWVGAAAPEIFLVLCLALSGALKRCGLPHCGYEMQEALTVALATSDAEARWLGGEDIFKNIQRDDEKSGESMDSNPQFQAIYNAAFAA